MDVAESVVDSGVVAVVTVALDEADSGVKLGTAVSDVAEVAVV